jgi:hypothetical protein
LIGKGEGARNDKGPTLVAGDRKMFLYRVAASRMGMARVVASLMPSCTQLTTSCAGHGMTQLHRGLDLHTTDDLLCRSLVPGAAMPWTQPLPHTCPEPPIPTKPGR